MQAKQDHTDIPYTENNTAYGEAEVIIKRLRRADSLDDLAGRPPMEPSIFKNAIKLEYPRLELLWKQCLEFEAGTASLAKKYISSLALINEGFDDVTIHDVEDLHNEIKVCLLQLSEKRNCMGC